MSEQLKATGNVFLAMKASPPNLTEAAAACFLRDHYGIDGTLRVLVSERDENFHVKRVDGQSFVLKIANSAEAAEVTDFQIAALLHVAKTDPEFPVPRIVRTLNGSSQTTIVAEDGREHAARVLTWLNGLPLCDAIPKPDNATELGEMLARLGIALRDFEHPASNYRLLWDIKGAENLVELLDHIKDDGLQTTCRQHLCVFEEHTKSVLRGLRSQVIFNDLHSGNVLVDSNDPETITGIIDFGDIVKSPLIIDVAVATAYLLDDGDLPLAGITKFLSAYSRIRPLRQEEIDLLYDLILTRNVMTIIISHWRATQYPENREYILQGESQARITVDTLKALGRVKVTDEFRKACLSQMAGTELEY